MQFRVIKRTRKNVKFEINYSNELKGFKSLIKTFCIKNVEGGWWYVKICKDKPNYLISEMLQLLEERRN